MSFVNELSFEIANGQQTSSIAETYLNQRRLPSTLKWPHYKFTSSETHWHINQVLTRISIATTFLQTHDRSFLRSMQTWTLSLIPPIFRETRQTNAMTSQHPIATGPHLRSKIRWFTESCNSHCQFVIDVQTKRPIDPRYEVSLSSQHTDTVILWNSLR